APLPSFERSRGRDLGRVRSQESRDDPAALALPPRPPHRCVPTDHQALACRGAAMNELGIRWPAEWESQQAVWLAWPHHEADWPDRFGPIPWVYADFISKLCKVVQV